MVSIWLAASYSFHTVKSGKTSNLSRVVASPATKRQTEGLLLKWEAFKRKKNVSVSHRETHNRSLSGQEVLTTMNGEAVKPQQPQQQQSEAAA